MDELPGPRELILEANDVNGKLWAKKKVFKENEYMKLPGAQMKKLKPKSLDETLRTSEDLLAEFCDRWNQQGYYYKVPSSTCHLFAEKLCEFLGLDLPDWSIMRTITTGIISFSAVFIAGISSFLLIRRRDNNN